VLLSHHCKPVVRLEAKGHMQALTEKFGPYAWIVATAIGIIIAIVLLFLLARLIFGNRVRPSGGGRARQPRLGVVDAYDLDRQRQLVLVRRDNVEHLVMIGGPNDVLIESSIIRQSAQGLEPRGRQSPTFEDGPSTPSAVAPPPAPIAISSLPVQSETPSPLQATAPTAPPVVSRPPPALPPLPPRPAQAKGQTQPPVPAPEPPAPMAPSPVRQPASVAPRTPPLPRATNFGAPPRRPDQLMPNPPEDEGAKPADTAKPMEPAKTVEPPNGQGFKPSEIEAKSSEAPAKPRFDFSRVNPRLRGEPSASSAPAVTPPLNGDQTRTTPPVAAIAKVETAKIEMPKVDVNHADIRKVDPPKVDVAPPAPVQTMVIPPPMPAPPPIPTPQAVAPPAIVTPPPPPKPAPVEPAPIKDAPAKTEPAKVEHGSDDALADLEAEMAKLLGRPDDKP
jgi:flagellar protein FliO/FliZ